MYPDILHSFGIPVSTYGFFLSLAHVVGITLLLLTARAHRYPIAPFLDILFAVTISGLIGARLGYVFSQWSEFRDAPLSVFALSKGGLSFFGGFPLAFFAFLAVARLRRLPFFEISDLVSPILPFTLAIVRLGCFAQGCCHGAPTKVPWAVHYNNLESRVPPALFPHGLHPTQLYEAALLLLLSLLLFFTTSRRPFRPGVLATLSIFAYSLYRFFADEYRGDLQRGFWGVDWLSPTQGAAILGMLATPVVLWICLRMGKRHRANL